MSQFSTITDMKVIILNDDQANKLRGQYKPNHTCEPVEIENNFHILHASIIDEVSELKVKTLFYKISFTKGFVIGDNSNDDKKYKAWKELNKNE